MKRAVTIFVILFIFTLLIPLVSLAEHQKQSNEQELVTIFSSEITAKAELPIR